MSKEINLMNRIIIGAILHGGDPGGPWFCNRAKLVEALEEWLEDNELDKEYKVSKDDYCLIVPIDSEQEDDDWQGIF